MHNSKNRVKKYLMFIAIAGCLGIFLFTSLGCEPLRKKFRRKKKEDKKSQVVPILDPIDYEPRIQSAEEYYKYHYSLWQVWQKDFSQMIDEASDKRKKYLINQIIVQLTEMSQWLIGPKQEELSVVIKDYEKISRDLNKPAGMQSTTRIKKKLRLNEKKIRNHFHPTAELQYKK